MAVRKSASVRARFPLPAGEGQGEGELHKSICTSDSSPLRRGMGTFSSVMKHLITGGSGFLGNLIARRLHARGEQVRILDVWEDVSRPKEIEFVNCDIRDTEGVAGAMRGVDVVHHNVALVPLTKAGPEFWSVNVEGSRIAAQQAARAGVKTFIHMSSSAIFGVPEQCPVTNNTLMEPVEIYGRAKLAG